KLPLRGTGHSWGIQIQGKPELEASSTYFRIVTQDYFKTLRVPILRGRDFSDADHAETERVVMINQALAEKYFPGENPLGRIILTGFPGGERVIGVIGNVAEANLTDPAAPARYMLYDQVPYTAERVTYVLSAISDAAIPGILRAAGSTVRQQGRHV